MSETVARDPLRWPSPLKSKAFRRFLRNPSAVASAAFLVFLITVATFAPAFAPHDPYKQNLPDRRAAPNETYLLGADEFGRDLLSRVIYGARVALQPALGTPELLHLGVALDGVPQRPFESRGVRLVLGDEVLGPAAHDRGAPTNSSCGRWTCCWRFPTCFSRSPS